MKHILKSECPVGLTEYLLENPNATWENFGNEAQEVYTIVQNRIKDDQLGICCYCEIDFYVSDDSSIKDFRVEHFYPKSKTPLPTGENAHLTWLNLLGCCHGGTQHFYIADERFTTKKNRHCDANKGEKDWTNIIFNPLHIPEGVKIFTFQTDGKIMVSAQCPKELKTMAQSSIDRLNLNEETYLVKAREKVRAEIAAQFDALTKTGQNPEDALVFLKDALFGDTATNMKFYTCKLDYVSY
ncbi:TIGR02646 family protein [Acinetobacter junii]|uniref:retron system putative HNH endonuclease n=1 Tax=Acinetobacter junii TaxID=40215 RepID=UPI0012986A30|nr:retron system putative HNH endonuclease [Acinetobacter junii]MQZ55922.1 TIGR02646 family protein [Acinetobacter junii]